MRYPNRFGAGHIDQLMLRIILVYSVKYDWKDETIFICLCWSKERNSWPRIEFSAIISDTKIVREMTAHNPVAMGLCLILESGDEQVE